MRTLAFFACIGLFAIMGAVAAGIYFIGGHYSVAGTAADPSLLAWALTHIRTTSIERHAKDSPPLSRFDNRASGSARFFRARLHELSRWTRREMG
jgi:hypothetical protein